MQYLASALSAIDTERVEIHIRDPASAVRICPAGDLANSITIMPMRI